MWTVESLRSYREYPQSNEVIAKAIEVAESRVKAIPGCEAMMPSQVDLALLDFADLELDCDDACVRQEFARILAEQHSPLVCVHS